MGSDYEGTQGHWQQIGDHMLNWTKFHYSSRNDEIFHMLCNFTRVGVHCDESNRSSPFVMLLVDVLIYPENRQKSFGRLETNGRNWCESINIIVLKVTIACRENDPFLETKQTFCDEGASVNSRRRLLQPPRTQPVRPRPFKALKPCAWLIKKMLCNMLGSRVCDLWSILDTIIIAATHLWKEGKTAMSGTPRIRWSWKKQ